MKRLSLFALSAYITLQPVLASAAFQAPQDLINSMRADGAPRSFTAEVHSTIGNEQSGNVYITAWINGAQEGTTLATGLVNTVATIDMSVPSFFVKARAKVAMRLVNKNIYVQLQSLDGNYNTALTSFAVYGLMKKWIQIPLSDYDISALEHVSNGDTNADDMMTMDRTPTKSGASYSVHFKRDFLKQLAATMDMQGVPNFHAIIQTNAKEQMLSTKVYAGLKFASANVVFTAAAKKISSMPTVIAPTNVITIDELHKQMGMMDALTSNPLDFMRTPSTESSSFDTTYPHPHEFGQSSSDSMMIEDSSSSIDQDLPSTPSASRAMVPTARVSPRTARNAAMAQEAARAESHTTSSNVAYPQVGDYTPASPADGLSMGKANAPVTIVEFGDYECPYCATFHTDTFQKIKARFIDTGKVRFVYRNFPLSFHVDANDAALTVECVRDESDALAWKVHDVIFNDLAAGKDPTPSHLQDILTSVGARVVDVQDCVGLGTKQSIIDQDKKDADTGGVSGTPSFWVLGSNGKAELIQGAYPFETFQKVLENMLK